MSEGPDLFVVCSQCGSEVSPYVTECPYCGHRLRKRAPNLPRELVSGRTPRGLGGRLRSVKAGRSAPAPSRLRSRATGTGLLSGTDTVPRMTIALVAISAVVWIVWHARPKLLLEMAIIGPLEGDWWRLFTSLFAYSNGIYAFLVLVSIGIFGWLAERRHGPAIVLALFLAAGAAGGLVSLAVYSEPVITGANGPALALLALWAVPDLEALRAGDYYEGDLLGAGAFAVLLLVSPFAIFSASWLSGVVGAVIGLGVGFGLASLGEPST